MDYDKAQDVIITILEVNIHTQGNQEAKRNICKSKEINLLAFSFIGFY